jgi:quercetin dioxygenase-like cupin family protein
MSDTQRGPEPAVRRLADLVAWQPGAVISRALIKKPAGTVTLFAFDEGEGLSEHTAPFEALVLVLEGEADIAIDGAPHRVTSGESIVLPAGRPHAVRAAGRFKMMLVMVKE